MSSQQVRAAPGTEGYAEDATWLIPRYDSSSFEDKYRAVSHLMPTAPSSVLDIGAGTGSDSVWLAARGHKVMAIEPVTEFRNAGIQRHFPLQIDWIDDSLPDLVKVARCLESFDLVLVAAVWHHLTPDDRIVAMSNIARLLKNGAILIMSIRHGPSPANRRRVFEVSADETIDLAISYGLKKMLETQTASAQQINQKAGVTWTWLAFANERFIPAEYINNQCNCAESHCRDHLFIGHIGSTKRHRLWPGSRLLQARP